MATTSPPTARWAEVELKERDKVSRQGRNLSFAGTGLQPLDYETDWKPGERCATNCRSFVDRGHLARIGHSGRDARAPRFADRPRSVVSRRARRPRSQIRGRRSGRFLRGPRASCPHSFLRARRPRSQIRRPPALRGFAAGETPTLPDSRTAFRPIPLWTAGILPAFVFAGRTPALRVLFQREGPFTGLAPWRWSADTRHECRAEDHLRRQTPAGGRRRTTSCRRSSRYCARGRE